MNKRLLMTLISLAMVCQALAVGAATVSSQQQNYPAPTGLALEVTYYKDKPPAFVTIPGPDAKANGAWFGFFRRVPSWQPPAEALPVRAVNILSRLEGDAVRIEVSVYLGVRFFEKEQGVATYRVRENEKISVEGLSRFGVEPFEIKVLRVNPITTNTPVVVNRTESLEVVGVQANNSTFPSYTVTVRNLSGKNVAALGIKVLADGKNQGSSLPRRREGKSLIAAGATYDILIPGAKTAQLTPVGFSPDSPLNQDIVIGTAVFEDGSYEGEPETAAEFKGFEFGSKIQVPRLIALIQEAANDTSVITSLERLKAQVSSLSDKVKTAAFNEFLAGFPSLTPREKSMLKTNIEVALAGEKFDFLKRIQEFEKSGTQSSDANAFRTWLSDNEKRYATWLSQLQAE